jgi:serine/threonine protein kinase
MKTRLIILNFTRLPNDDVSLYVNNSCGIYKIGDFGLAKSLSTSNQTSAMTSTIFGTSAYMAPEAFRGDISPKMDIFSLGVV